MKTQNTLLKILMVMVIIGLTATPVLAQTPAAVEYKLNLNRDFGYGGGASIRGLFSARVVGPEGIESVKYLIDGQEMAVVTTTPFKFQFNTSQYAFGWHDLSAEVTAGGKVYQTPSRRFNFVTSEQESADMGKIMLPLLGLLGVVFVTIFVAQFLLFRKRKLNPIEPGTERNYGIYGGAICKKCGGPTPRHMWGMNMGFGKLDRCENCGKWSIMRAAPMSVLRAAELAEKQAQPVVDSEKTREQQLREMLEKSKYE